MKKLTLKRWAKLMWKIIYGLFAIIGLLTVAAIIILNIYVSKTGQSAYFCTGPYPSITFPKVAFGISLSPNPSVALRLNSDKLRASGKYANATSRTSPFAIIPNSTKKAVARSATTTPTSPKTAIGIAVGKHFTMTKSRRPIRMSGDTFTSSHRVSSRLALTATMS